MFLLLLTCLASIALARYGDDPLLSYEERTMSHLVNAARIDARSCLEHGYCGRFLDKVCDGKPCSLDRVLSPSVYASVAPLRYSRALSGACREHIAALDACGAAGVEHEQPSTPTPCDGSTTAARVQRVCPSGTVGAFGELLAVHAADGRKATAQLPLTQWLCDFDGSRCAPDQRGLSTDSRRELLLNPTSPACCANDDGSGGNCRAQFDDETGDGTCTGSACRACTNNDAKIEFHTIGVAYVERKNGEHSWCVDLTSGSCDVSAADEREAIYSATHLLNQERKGTTTFIATFWPKLDEGDVTATLVLENERVQMRKQFPSTTNVRGHYAVQTNHHRVDDCRQYHFEFAQRDASGAVRAYRYPDVGKLMTFGEGVCVDSYDPLGISLSKRQFNNPNLEDVTVRADLTIDSGNALERSDRSRKGVLAPRSIAATEAANVTLVVSHLGFVNATAAAAKFLSGAVRFRYNVTCSLPGSALRLDQFSLSAVNGTSGNLINASLPLPDGDVGSITTNNVSFIQFTTAVLQQNWTDTLKFRVQTDRFASTANLTCTASANAILNSAGNAVTEPEFRNDTTFRDARDQILVERRVDLVVTIAQSRDVVVATDVAPDNTATQTVTIANNGPVDAHNVVLGIRFRSLEGTSLIATPVDAVVFAKDVIIFSIGNLAIGQSASRTITWRTSATAHEGAINEIEAYVHSVDEKTIFIFDDVARASIKAERHVDFRVSHELVIKDGVAHDSATLTLYVQNKGPSEVAVATLIVVVRPPQGVDIDAISVERGMLIEARADELYEHKRDYPPGPFHYWVIDQLAVGEKLRLTFRMHADEFRHVSSKLSVAIGVERKRTRESVVLNEADDFLLFQKFL